MIYFKYFMKMRLLILVGALMLGMMGVVEGAGLGCGGVGRWWGVVGGGLVGGGGWVVVVVVWWW